MSLKVLSLSNGFFQAVDASKITSLINKPKSVLWLDIQSPSIEDKKFIKESFSFPKLFLDNSFSFNKRPKMEQQKDFVFFVVESLHYEEFEIHKHELNIFLGKNYLISVHETSLDSIELVEKNVSEKNHLIPKSPDLLFYLILSNLLDAYFPILDEIDDVLDSFETRLFSNPNEQTLSSLFKVKRVVLEFRKILSPQRELLLFLTNRQSSFIKPGNILFFRDLFDHTIRMQDMIDTYRDLITSSLEAYLSIVSNRMNEVMKFLTIFTTILFPMSLIAGIYGMNFQFMPEIHSPLGKQFGYFFALGAMVLVAIIMLLYFRRKKWI